MQQIPLLFEDVFDALRFLVQSCGGAKRIGAALYPEKPADAAGRYLMDCLNPGRAEQLGIERLLMMLRIGQENGCHAATHYICQNSGYSTPEPIKPEDERADLERKFIESVQQQNVMLNRIMALRKGPGL